MNLGRWALVLPGAIAATAVLWGINIVVDWIVTWFLSWIPLLGWLYVIWFFFDVIALSGFAGTVYVVSGAAIAPSHQKETAQFLSGLALFAAGAGLIWLWQAEELNWVRVVSAALFVISAAYAAARYESDPPSAALYE